MHHTCQFSLCRLRVLGYRSRNPGMVPGAEKKSFFLRPFLGSTPLRSSSKSKIRSHKENEIFPSHFVAYMHHFVAARLYNPVLGLLQPFTMVVTVSITRLNTRLLQSCFMVVTTTLLQPCCRMSLFTGLDYWTGLLDSTFTHKISFPAQLQPLKAIVSPHLKQCPSFGH